MRNLLPIRNLLLLAAAALLFTAGRPQRLGDIYDCYIIVDAEYSCDGDDYYQVDYEELISTITRARRSYIAFEPKWQVNLFDDDGIRYFLYVSRTATYLRIDSNYFRLSRRQARRLRHLLGS